MKWYEWLFIIIAIVLFCFMVVYDAKRNMREVRIITVNGCHTTFYHDTLWTLEPVDFEKVTRP